jgi:hypothetical protein
MIIVYRQWLVLASPRSLLFVDCSHGFVRNAPARVKLCLQEFHLLHQCIMFDRSHQMLSQVQIKYLAQKWMSQELLLCELFHLFVSLQRAPQDGNRPFFCYQNSLAGESCLVQVGKDLAYIYAMTWVLPTLLFRSTLPQQVIVLLLDQDFIVSKKAKLLA